MIGVSGLNKDPQSKHTIRDSTHIGMTKIMLKPHPSLGSLNLKCPVHSAHMRDVRRGPIICRFNVLEFAQSPQTTHTKAASSSEGGDNTCGNMLPMAVMYFPRDTCRMPPCFNLATAAVLPSAIVDRNVILNRRRFSRTPSSIPTPVQLRHPTSPPWGQSPHHLTSWFPQ